MKTYTAQSGAMPQEIRILSDKVLTAENVHTVTVPDDSDVQMYEYTVHEYTKDEYIRVLKTEIVLTEDALCDEDSAIDKRLGIIEDVLCEIDEKINGGE